MTQPPRPTRPGQSPPPERPADDQGYLELEDSSEGSTTQPVRDSSASPTSPGGQEDIGVLRAGADITGEASTVGFETMLGTLVVENGLVTADEIELCNSVMRESAASEEPRTLAEVLLENDFVTQRQLQRLRGEFEARKSSQRIPGYRILSKIGAGAMATVFLARQLSLDRDVAIKVLPKKFSQNTKFIERFYKEGKAAAQLNDPNIVAAYDVGQAGDHHYFVMEYIDGPTVYDRLIKQKRFSEREAINAVLQVAKALQHAHARGFIHRDIKPKNIMFNSAGVVKLADLGLARAMSDKEAAKAEAGRAYGTPYYISPEQIRGEIKIGPPADIYGLGATFYHMVTGRVPFEGKNPSAVMHQHLRSELVPPDHVNPKLSAGSAQVIEMMMEKDPRRRYQTATDLLHDLELIADGRPPHFAHKALDLSDVATAIATDAARTTAVMVQQPGGHGVRGRGTAQRAQSDGGSTLIMIAFVLLGISILANIILAVALAT